MSKIGTVLATGGAGNLYATNELPTDMHKKTMSALTGLTPLTTILTRLGEDKAHNFRVDWQEEKDMPDLVYVAVSEASASTSITVKEHGKSLVKDTLLFNPRTKDIRLVDTTPTTNAVTVTISQGGTTSAKWLANDPVHVLPPAVAEDDEDNYRDASAVDSNVYNYVQLVRMQFSITRIANAQTTEFGGPGSKRASLKTQKYREFRKKWEKMLYFGGRATGGTSPSDKRMSGGLRHFLDNGTLYKDYNGIFTESGWDNFLLSYHEENPDTQTIDAFVSPNVMQKISYFAKGKIRLSPMSKKYGMAIDQYIAPGMKVNLIELPLLNDSVTRGWGFLLDLQRIRLKNLDNPIFYPDAKNIGQSEKIYDLYRVVTSMLVGNESAHAMFVGASL